MKIVQILLLGAALISLAGCQSRGIGTASEDGVAEERQLVVYAAASLKRAFDEISRQFESRHPGVEVLVNFAGSQQLAQQIAQGAPADVFASADDRQMAVAIGSGRIDPAAPQIFIQNRLVVILPPENPGSLTSLRDLTRPGLRLVFADEKVPVGGYAAQFLEAASRDPQYGHDFKAQVLENVVSFEENVQAVTSKVALGEADGGVVYLSDYVSAPPETLSAIQIPNHLNPIAAYPIAPVEDTIRMDLALAFIAFVRGPEGQAILAHFGYMALPEG